MEDYQLDDIVFDPRAAIAPGHTAQLLIIAVDDVETVPPLLTSADDDFRPLTLKGNIDLKADKKWTKVDIEVESADFIEEVVGNGEGTHLKTELPFKIVGSSREQKAAIHKLHKRRIMVVITDKALEKRVVGSKEFPCRIKYKATKGTGEGGYNGTEMSLAVPVMTDPWPYYDGDLVL